MNVKLSTFAFSVFLIVPTWLYFTQPGGGRSASTTNSKDRTKTYRSAFIAVHAVYILYRIFFGAPVNLFSALRLPFNAPPDVVRETLLLVAGDELKELPPVLEMLLKRLNSFDARTYYIRFGHDTLLKCQHCVGFYDYALFAFPRPFFEYVREAAVVGFITTRRSGRLRWRKFAVGILVLAAVAEAYLTMTKILIVDEKTRTKTTSLHDRLWLLRHLLFFVLPPVLFLLPPSPETVSPLAASLPQLTVLADQTLARIHLLKYTRGAVTRNPALRNNVAEWWERERTEGEWATSDDEVKELAAKLGMDLADGDEGNEPGALRKRARMAVEGLKGAFRPSDFLQT
ncbi:hypothetical protein SCHPADRAFT_967202 [Schizopora paradoxa]|uniref:Uncharacterized protein n=1 Tax=Schizopora paradoxa TaxID=27342 RepID=A0A0H2SAZ2_9AGAM|nr:hypothetical protein SCHPADRAFT_967202 [Schizopora paradoxa]